MIGNGAFNGCISLEKITLPFVGKSENAADYEAVFGYTMKNGHDRTINTSLYDGAPTYFYNNS